jgi:hypothetical protein
MRLKLTALAIFLIIGMCKLPLERSAQTAMREAGSLKTPASLALREQLGQMAFAASLGGLRSLVASVVYLQAYTAFERSNWAQVESLHTLTTQLQPNYAQYWDDGATRLAYDAASHYLYDTARPDLYRRQLYRQYFGRGVDFAQSGAAVLPASRVLHQRLGEFYSRIVGSPEQKQLVPPDHRLAARHFILAHQHGALDWTERAAAYELAKLPDAPEEWALAYRILKKYHERGIRVPTASTLIKDLENRLKVPAEQRVKD